MHTIRRLSLGDGMLYREIRLESLRESPAAFTTTLESALAREDVSWATQADLSSTGNDRATFLVLADRPIGLGAVYRNADDHSSGDLIQMWISPSYRGRSVAADLLDHIFQWAADHDFASIRAEITEGNQQALRCYLKYGFQLDSSYGGNTLLTKFVGARHSKKKG